MAYHEAFWIASATAAPVIGLAHTVSFERFIRAWWNSGETNAAARIMLTQYDEISGHTKMPVKRWVIRAGVLLTRISTFGPYLLALFGISLMTVVLTASMWCLSSESDGLSRGLIIWFLGVALGILTVQATLIAMYAELTELFMKRRARDSARRPEKETQWPAE